MPLTVKGKKIMSSMRKSYGPSKGKQVFHASLNAGKLSSVHRDRGFFGHYSAKAISSRPIQTSVHTKRMG